MNKAFIKNKNDYMEWISYELKKYRARKGFIGWLRRFFPLSEKDCIIKHQVRLRKTEYYINTEKFLLATISKVILNRMQNKYMLHIPINTCGKGLFIPHLGPVLINWNSYIGHDCIININTALVATDKEGNAPQLGNCVTIGVGSVLIGKIELGNDITVGANSTVTKSFKENGIVIAGSPAKELNHN